MFVMLRTSVTNEAVAERMRSIFSAQLVPVATKISGDHAAARKRAALAASQILGMALCRYVLALPPLGTMTRQELVDWPGPVVQRYVPSPA
ncbi:hypothetical protein ACQPZZ_21600 [Microbispora sp. CA-135349]|uniref:TetR/AcrR family transcriptional regulator n=1 Tax=Microbispora sp. CA-135349 TaxID=3239953 RepID=UPI003D948950